MFDVYPDSLVEVWALNKNTGLEWLEPYRQGHNLHLPIMQHSDEAFTRFRLGRQFHTVEPLYTVIDRRGVVRLRSWGQGSVSIEEVAELVRELLEEG